MGAGAVVTKSLPAYSISAGVPAKIIKMRFNDSVIDKLIQIKWWEWSEEKIKKNRKLFETDFSLYEDINQFLLEEIE